MNIRFSSNVTVNMGLSLIVLTGLGWPFDLRFLWNVLTLFLLLAILETSLLPLSINVKKVAPPPRVPTESEEPEGVEETKV